MRFTQPLAVLVAVGSTIVFLACFWLLHTYSTLLQSQQAAVETWMVAQEAYQQRFDMIPSLADSTKSLVAQEREVFDHLAMARQNYAVAGDVYTQVTRAVQLEQALSRWEQAMIPYADDVASATNSSVTEALNKIPVSEDITQKTDVYNQEAQVHNQKLDQAFSMLVVRLFEFRKLPLFEV